MCNNCNTINSPATIHVFEVAGLGSAPFTFVGVDYNQKGTHCDYCGTAIVNVFWVRGSCGKTFKVGCDCIAKTHDAGLIRIVDGIQRKHDRDMREAKAKAIRAELVAMSTDLLMMETLTAKAHPLGYMKDAGYVKDANGNYLRDENNHLIYNKGTPKTGLDFLIRELQYGSKTMLAKVYRWIKCGSPSKSGRWY